MRRALPGQSAWFHILLLLAAAAGFRWAYDRYEPPATTAVDVAQALVIESRLFAERGDAQRALEAIRRAIALRPDFAPAHFNLGVVLERSGDLAGAEAAYRRALASDDRLAVAHLNLGSLLANAGQLDEAAEHFAKAQTLPQARQYLEQLNRQRRPGEDRR